LQEANRGAILSRFGRDSFVVSLSIHPDFASSKAINYQEESKSTPVVAEIQGPWNVQENAGCLTIAYIVIDPDAVFYVRVLPMLWIRCLCPAERLFDLS